MGINYQEIAKCIAAASKDPRYKVGAIIFDAAGNIRSTGYNGAPRGVIDSPERYEKPLKQYYIAHAEENAIVQAARAGVSTEGCCILIWGKIQAGIKSVLFQATDARMSSYLESFVASQNMLKEAGIAITYLPEK
jgi:dCMP deaminase